MNFEITVFAKKIIVINFRSSYQSPTEQKIDRMCKYTEHLDRQDLCRISLYSELQNKQWPGYKYLHIYSLFAGKQERTVPESRHFCDLCMSIN